MLPYGDNPKMPGIPQIEKYPAFFGADNPVLNTQVLIFISPSQK